MFEPIVPHAIGESSALAHLVQIVIAIFGRSSLVLRRFVQTLGIKQIEVCQANDRKGILPDDDACRNHRIAVID